MKAAPYNMLLEAASRYNILTLTTSCAAACVFCSHHQNPKEVEAYYINKLSKEEAENLVEFLDGNSKITIGESATRICEGEPFAFEYLMHILRLIREKYPNVIIQITTSGINIDEAILKELKDLQNIELNISLNSCNEAGRKKLYGGKAHMQGIATVEMLKKYDIKWGGSIVAMPHVVGWEDLRQTIAYLSDRGAATIRVFMPGYTKYTKIALPDNSINQELEKMAKALQNTIKTPIIVEPSIINSLDAIVEGVISNSPAGHTSLSEGCKIVSINGKAVYSRVDAYNRLYATSNPEVSFEKDGKLLSCLISKNKNSSAGLVFNYDIDPETAVRLERRIKKFSPKECLMLVSKLGYGIINKVIESSENLKIEIVANSYFGGNIMCAGLLVLEDIKDVLRAQCKLPQVVFLPQVMFDEKGRDLVGRHYMELEQEFDIEVVVL
ncbi:MAG: radical superfamily enzymePDZ protein [Clostridia bacterium]|jgi:MoaA/NifB/PqqE/SkfB family radical SAM enzyme|nr:radical superfamily enzymePDZ protein [Clostridia bacterium]